MDIIYGGIIRYRKLIMAVFAAAAVVCAFLSTKVYVDYEILNYLPQESPSTVSLSVMKEEFGAEIPNARVMIKDVDRAEALQYKKRLEAVDGVISVNWLDTMFPLSMPLEIVPDSIRDSYYSNGNALFILTIDEEKQIETISAIYDVIGEDNMLCGMAAITAVATVNTVREILRITIISVIFLIIVLMLTTTSWFEPFVIFVSLIMAVVINAGTNLVFGKISFITNSAGMILQMALSLDYSVFLLHRFNECRELDEPEEAMKKALRLTTSSIMSSGLTTVIGFLALATMRFLLGADLGLALSKGVAISLFTALVFLPGLILSTYKLIEKTRHRSFVPSFGRFGRLVSKVTIPVGICFVLAIVPAYIASVHNHYVYGSSNVYGTNTRIGSDTAAIIEAFGNQDTYVMMVPAGDMTSENALLRELKKYPEITSAMSAASLSGMSLPVEMLPQTLISQLRSENYDRIVLYVDLSPDSDETHEFVEQLRQTADRYYPGSCYIVGQGVNVTDLRNVVTSDMVRVNAVAIIAVLLVLILTMRNVFLSVILVLTIETSIWINMSMSYIRGMTLFYLAYLIVSSVQLGATVDYAILLTQRYRENRQISGMAPRECIVTTISDTAVSILTSATVVSVMGFMLYLFSTQLVIAQLGLLIGRGTLCSLFAVLFVLPGFLKTYDEFTAARSRHKS